MTEIAQIYLGNIHHNSQVAKQVLREACLEVSLNQSDRAKGRIHAHTDEGIAVGIIKSRDRLLQSGDVFQTDSKKLLIVRLQDIELLVLDFSTLDNKIAPSKLVYLGHVLGNHHYPVTIQDGKIYVQLTTERKILEQIINDVKVPGLQIEYAMPNIAHNIEFTSHNH
ncbi:urease accessory protein UreE [Waterburya agarophytonicola K14]|uniref:Urease accessory protein UreE n=1 Tax=Waterburya agarophytonicola KI4 TaxID=2874699 RepID=A0A964BTJ6_9CYAN|nr:urease accessory protein UreE [Waterburya agarophytonicola]MCC0178854.1 urease accessory protein UreE [Waterburya agarophytonicola KI4]